MATTTELEIVLRVVNEAKGVVDDFVRKINAVKGVIQDTNKTKAFDGVPEAIAEIKKTADAAVISLSEIVDSSKDAGKSLDEMGDSAKKAKEDVKDIRIDPELSGVELAKQQLDEVRDRSIRLQQVLSTNKDALGNNFKGLTDALDRINFLVDTIGQKFSQPERFAPSFGLVSKQAAGQIESITKLEQVVAETLSKAAEESREKMAEVGKASAETGNRLSALQPVIDFVSSGLGRLAAAATAAVVGFFALSKLINGLKTSLREAVEAEQLQVSLDALGNSLGFTKEQIDGTVASLQAFGISGSDAQRATTKLLKAELGLAEATKLGAAAQSLALVSGTSVSEMYDKLAFGLQTLNLRNLRQAGIFINQEKVFESYAKKLGTVSNALTDYEKRLAILGEIEKKAIDSQSALSAAIGSPFLRLQQVDVAVKDLAEAVGGILVPAYTQFLTTGLQLITALTGVANSLSVTSGGTNLLAGGIKLLGDLVEGIINTLGGLVESFGAVLSIVQTVEFAFPVLAAVAIANITKIRVAVVGLYTLIAAHPIGALLLAVVALGTFVIEKYGPGITRVFSILAEVIETARVGLIAVGQLLAGNLQGAIATAQGALSLLQLNKELNAVKQKQFEIESRIRALRQSGRDTSQLEKELKLLKEREKELLANVAAEKRTSGLGTGTETNKLSQLQRQQLAKVQEAMQGLINTTEFGTQRFTKAGAEAISRLTTVVDAYLEKLKDSNGEIEVSYEEVAEAVQETFKKLSNISEIEAALQQIVRLAVLSSDQIRTLTVRGALQAQQAAQKQLTEGLAIYEDALNAITKARKDSLEFESDALKTSQALQRAELEGTKSNALEIARLKSKQTAQTIDFILKEKFTLEKNLEEAMQVRVRDIVATVNNERDRYEQLNGLERRYAVQRAAINRETLNSLRGIRDEQIRTAADLKRQLDAIEAQKTRSQITRENESREIQRKGLTEYEAYVNRRVEAGVLLQKAEQDIGRGDDNSVEAAKQRLELVKKLVGEISSASELDPSAATRAEIYNERRIQLENLLLSTQEKNLKEKKKINEADLAQTQQLIDDLTAKLKAITSDELSTYRIKVDAESIKSGIQTIQDMFDKADFKIKATIEAAVAGGVNVTAGGAAHGGLIGGTSPSATADDKLTWLTSGEYVHPVRAVRHYGLAFMNSIRNLSLPRYATGGLVGALAVPAGDASGPVQTVNIVMNKKPVGTFTGDRKAVKNLISALQEVSRGT